MKSDVYGCSTCPAGEERFEEFKTRLGRMPVVMVQYDYRTPDGRLFSTVARTVEVCRGRRDAWLGGYKEVPS